MFYINFIVFFFLLYLIFILNFATFNKFFNVFIYSLFCFLSLFFILIFLIYLWPQLFFYNNIWELKLTNFTNNYFLIPYNLHFELNILNYSFLFLVVLIGSATNIYLFNYFKGEANEYLFVFWLNSFIISMMTLVCAGNLFTLFLGWELIGLTSFFLINFWSNRRSTLKSSFKAFFFNLISDICLLGSFVLYYHIYGTDDINVILYLTQYSVTGKNFLLQLATIFFVICCSVKSVQIIGHLWLPDSMEAPVPASALIHSATLVSAGIFLLNKFSLVLYVNSSINILCLIGAITALYGGLVCSAQTDLKKLLAYSTMSHCGFLWILAVSGNFLLLVLYLFIHGIYKAATFYCAGSFIRVFNTQDSRWMGNGLKYLPADSFLLLFCSANLAGLPFTIGFFYKLFFFKFLFLSNFYFTIIICLSLAFLCSIVYFFRLNFYLLFDFYKNIRNLNLFYLNKTKIIFLKICILLIIIRCFPCFFWFFFLF